jgi:transposase-like protein
VEKKDFMTAHLNQVYSELAPAGTSEGSAGERSETARTVEAPAGARDPSPLPDPEVSDRAHRRTFTAKYKERILEEISRGNTPVGQILRREGLYYSQIAAWQKKVSKQNLAALQPNTRGPKPAPKNPLAAENAELKRQTVKLEKRLHKVELMLEFQKKVSQILGITIPIFEDEIEETNPGESESNS